MKLNSQIDKQLSKTVLNLKGLYHEILIQIKTFSMFKKNTTEWEKLQYKKVTGNHLPALLGIFSKSKFEDSWKIVSAGLTEKIFEEVTTTKMKLWSILIEKPMVMPKIWLFFLCKKQYLWCKSRWIS